MILTSTEDVSFETGLSLEKQLQAAEMEVFKPAAFEPDNFKAAILSQIKNSGIQIVIFVTIEGIQTVASTAQTEGMTGAGWAWVLLYMLPPMQAMQGWLYLRPLLPSEGMEDFAQQVSDYSKSSFNISVLPESVDLTYSAAMYNSIMLYAHAATRVLFEGGDLRDGKAVTIAVRSTNFSGVGGAVVALDSNGDRIESYEVMNYVQKADGGINSVLVGMYDCNLQQFVEYQAVVWPPGNVTAVPLDSGTLDTRSPI